MVTLAASGAAVGNVLARLARPAAVGSAHVCSAAARPDADASRGTSGRPALRVRGQVGRVPRRRLHRRGAACPQPSRLGHDRPCAKLEALPEGLALDGELVAVDDDGRPSFPRLSNRVLHGHDGIVLTFVIFDVLAEDGKSTMALPYTARRSILERLDLHGASWCTPETFDDGERLFQAVVRQGLEGIVAKPLSSAYKPGGRDWLKVKNRRYWRFGQELELARSSRRRSP